MNYLDQDKISEMIECDYCDDDGEIEVYVSCMETPDGSGIVYERCPICKGMKKVSKEYYEQKIKELF